MSIDGAALVSGEGVALDLTPAGLGSRLVAAVLDVAVQVALILALFIVDLLLVSSADGAAIAAVAVTELVLVLAGYPIAMEWLAHGRTIGKLAMGLRVVRDDGGPIGFRQALTRGLAGLVLEKPGLLYPLTTIAGMLTIGLSSREKRIGDMMAGTIVLNERAARPSVLFTPPWTPPPQLWPWLTALDLHGLDNALALHVRQFLSRASQLTPAAQHGLGEDLRARVTAVIAPPPPPGVPTPFLLGGVLAERRRRASPELLPPRVVGTTGSGNNFGGGTVDADSPFAPPG